MNNKLFLLLITVLVSTSIFAQDFSDSTNNPQFNREKDNGIWRLLLAFSLFLIVTLARRLIKKQKTNAHG
jgi:hypothetical protein